jgi:peptidyl-dipeptidase A
VGEAAVVAEVEARLRPLATAANLAAWDANVASSDETRARRVQTELELTDLLSEPDLFRAVTEARQADGDPSARRGLDVLHDLLLPHQVPADLRRRIIELEASVESRFVSHRGVVGGQEVGDNEIKRILRSSDDVPERREAWEASKTVGAAVSDDVRELARLRNQAARSLGYRDWFALAVATMEMSEDKLFDTLAETDRATRPVFDRWKHELDQSLSTRFGCSVSELRPWHYADPFFQEVPVEGGVELDHVFSGRDLVELTRRTFDGLGLEVAAILDRSDLYPRDRKSQHAFCLDVDREGDIRVLCNVVDDAVWMDTMLHELGHGVFSAGHDPELPWLLRDCHLTTTEGIAILMGRLALDSDWLQRVAGLSEDEARELVQPLRAARAAGHVVFARWALVMTSFERALYGDPEADLDTSWWELASRYQRLTPPDGRRAPDWAAKIHVACAPVYYHTYLYGAITASQIAAVLSREAGGIVDRPAAGAYLAERVFRPGLTLRWDELLEHATGEPLASRYYATEIAEGLAA